MPGLGVDGGDHPVPRGLASDPEHPVLALLDVLPGYQRQQVNGIAGGERNSPPIDRVQRGQRIVHQLIDQGLAGLRVVPVTRRLTRAGVVVV